MIIMQIAKKDSDCIFASYKNAMHQATLFNNTIQPNVKINHGLQKWKKYIFKFFYSIIILVN